MMQAYVKTINVNEFDSILDVSVNFKKGLNILSGENGTGKTTIIKKIKEVANQNSPNIVYDTDDPNISNSNQLEIFALSPKRNSEKQNLDQIITRLRQQNKTIETYYNESKGKQINDATFDSYSSFGELFYYYFELNMKDGTTEPITVMNNVTKELNSVLQKVFPEYKIIAEWVSGKPNIQLKVSNNPTINLNSVSCGQQEVLSLIFNLYSTKDKYHIYLIDEPEIHLNWNLELGLFNFFDWFCSKYQKQIIATTHSRIIFKSKFYKNTQFLLWDNGKIALHKTISDESIRAIIGEMTSAITVVAPTSKTFFVEDKMHKKVIEEISNKFGKSIEVVICGNCENVKSLLRLSQSQNNSWRNKGYFIIDGDNQGPIKEFEKEERFIKLAKYSIESYLFNFRILRNILGLTLSDLRSKLLEIIISKKDIIFKKGGKSAEFAKECVTKIKRSDIKESIFSILDCSDIIVEFAKSHSMRKDDLVDKYLEKAKELSILNKIFDKQLIDAIKQ